MKKIKFPRVKRLLRRRIFVIFLLAVQLLAFLLLLADSSTRSKVIEAALIVFSVVVALFIIGREDNSDYKLTWVTIILIGQLFGGMFYLLFRAQSREKKLRALIDEKDGKAAVYLRAEDDESVLDSFRASWPQHISCAAYLHSVGYPLYAGEDVRYFSDGESMFGSMLGDMEEAKRSIYIETFIIGPGEVWDRMLGIMRRKAGEGLDVRLIYDDIGSFLRLPEDDIKDLEKSGIKVACYHPFTPFWSMLQNNRDHRKITVIDGEIAYTGGVNIADEYINRVRRFGRWKDAGIRLTGRAVRSFAVMYLRMWETIADSDEDWAGAYGDISAVGEGKADGGFIIPYDDSPLDREQVSENIYLKIISGAKDYLYIETPYLIPDEILIRALTVSARSGVDVRIITPHIPDKKFTFMTTRSFYPQLVKAGVRIYEYTPGFNHSKVMVADGEIANVGTANLDFRSLYLHYECGAVAVGGEVPERIREDFLATLGECELIGADHPLCADTLRNRLKRPICHLLAPLL